MFIRACVPAYAFCVRGVQRGIGRQACGVRRSRAGTGVADGCVPLYSGQAEACCQAHRAWSWRPRQYAAPQDVEARKRGCAEEEPAACGGSCVLASCVESELQQAARMRQPRDADVAAAAGRGPHLQQACRRVPNAKRGAKEKEQQVAQPAQHCRQLPSSSARRCQRRRGGGGFRNVGMRQHGSSGA